MKTLQLNLTKKLLIVDYENKEYFNITWNTYKTHYFLETSLDYLGDTFVCRPILNGLQMNEESYRSLLVDEEGGIKISKHPKSYLVSYTRHKNAFADLIEKEGYCWLENPIEEPTMSKYGWYASGHPEEDSGWMYEEGEEKYYEALKEYEDAESRTLKYPIIFEILE